jgi:hypothetical protein
LFWMLKGGQGRRLCYGRGRRLIFQAGSQNAARQERQQSENHPSHNLSYVLRRRRVQSGYMISDGDHRLMATGFKPILVLPLKRKHPKSHNRIARACRWQSRRVRAAISGLRLPNQSSNPPWK